MTQFNGFPTVGTVSLKNRMKISFMLYIHPTTGIEADCPLRPYKYMLTLNCQSSRVRLTRPNSLPCETGHLRYVKSDRVNSNSTD